MEEKGKQQPRPLGHQPGASWCPGRGHEQRHGVMQTTLSFPSSPCSWAVCNWRPTSTRYPEARDEHSQHDGKGGEMDFWGVPGAISLGDIRKFTGTTKAATQPGAPTRAHTCSSTHSRLSDALARPHAEPR